MTGSDDIRYAGRVLTHREAQLKALDLLGVAIAGDSRLGLAALVESSRIVTGKRQRAAFADRLRARRLHLMAGSL